MQGHKLEAPGPQAQCLLTVEYHATVTEAGLEILTGREGDGERTGSHLPGHPRGRHLLQE